jgi:hypothetical protein
MAGGGSILAAVAGVAQSLQLPAATACGFWPLGAALRGVQNPQALARNGAHLHSSADSLRSLSARPQKQAPSGHDKQQDQPEHHHDQAAHTNLMRRTFRYFTERVAPGARKNEGKHAFDNQHQRDREQ